MTHTEHTPTIYQKGLDKGWMFPFGASGSARASPRRFAENRRPLPNFTRGGAPGISIAFGSFYRYLSERRTREHSMRPGGESDKLANRYEVLWTTYQLMDVVRGEALSLTPEPIEDGIGVEFQKVLLNGGRESHSVKVSTTINGWTLSTLTRKRTNNRSFLGDLFEKTMASTSNNACFASPIGASSLQTLCEEAPRAANPAVFRRYTEVLPALLRAEFRSKVLPICNGELEVAWDQLRRIRVSTFPEFDLRKALERDRPGIL
jgi:hypothetical protein